MKVIKRYLQYLAEGGKQIVGNMRYNFEGDSRAYCAKDEEDLHPLHFTLLEFPEDATFGENFILPDVMEGEAYLHADEFNRCYLDILFGNRQGWKLCGVELSAASGGWVNFVFGKYANGRIVDNRALWTLDDLTPGAKFKISADGGDIFGIDEYIISVHEDEIVIHEKKDRKTARICTLSSEPVMDGTYCQEVEIIS